MSGFALALPADYNYVIAAASGTFLVNFFHSFLTSRARKQAGIAYPNAYADNALAEKDSKAFKFNCAQRAHANFHENLVPTLVSMMVAGLRWPLASATVGGVWMVSRVIYAHGYTQNGPKARLVGGIPSSLSSLVLGGMGLFAAAKLVL